MPLQIFIPFYGDPEFLRTAVRSVLAQDSPDWSLTVVDDRSPGESVREWLDALEDPRLRYVLNEVNLGSSGNFHRCLELAEGDLVTILGGDDELLPNYVRTVLDVRAQHPGCAMIQVGVEVIDENGNAASPLADQVKQRLLRPRTGGQRRVLSAERLAAGLLRGDWLYFPSLAFDRVAAQEVGFRPELTTVQDLALILELIYLGGSLILDDTVCFRYRRHGASESSWRAVSGGRFREEKAFFAEAEARARALGWPRAAAAARHHVFSRLHALTLVPGALRSRDSAGVRVLARHALRR